MREIDDEKVPRALSIGFELGLRGELRRRDDDGVQSLELLLGGGESGSEGFGSEEVACRGSHRMRRASADLQVVAGRFQFLRVAAE